MMSHLDFVAMISNIYSLIIMQGEWWFKITVGFCMLFVDHAMDFCVSHPNRHFVQEFHWLFSCD